MEEEKYIYTGYHGTCSKWYESIREFGLDPSKVKKRPDHWLGQGVYFYTDYELGLWWANDQTNKRYNINTNAIVYKARIEGTKCEVLNLDNRAELDKFVDYIFQVLPEIKKINKEFIFTQEQFRAVFFDYYKSSNNISIIIRIFNKPYASYTKPRKRDERKIMEKINKSLGLSFSETQICVSKRESIKNVELVYNGEYEVI